MADSGYTLPGVMHYLQQESTRNESNRIHWNSEREEMKKAIAMLTSENNALKQTNQRLEKELAQAKKGKSFNSTNNNKANNTTANGPSVAQLHLEPLQKAREHLKARMSEVVYLLKGSDTDMLDTVELKKERGLLAFTERKKKLQMENVAEASMTQNKVAGAPATPEPDSPSEFMKKRTTPEFKQEEPVATDAYPEDETDNETVMADEDIPSPNSPLLPHTPQTITEPIFSLASHPSNIVSLAVAHDQLLTGSKEGDIMLWPLSQMVADTTEAKPSHSFFDTDSPTILKWVNKDSFISASKKEVRYWDRNQTERPKAHIHTKGDIKDVQISGKLMIIHDLTGLTTYKLNNNTITNNMSGQHVKGTQDCQCFVLTPSFFYVYSKNGIDKYETQSITSDATYPVDDGFTSPPTHMSIWSDTLALSSIDKCILINLSSKSSVSIVPTKVSRLVNCVLSQKFCTLFYANGDVETYTASDGTLFSKLNHYSQMEIDEAFSRLVSSSVGAAYQEKYIITGGEDMQVRGWKFN